MELPNKDALGLIVKRYARVLAGTRDELGERPLVLPNGDFFPDRYLRDEASAAALARRMMEHAGLEDVPLAVRVVDERGPAAPHEGCSSGCQVPAAVAGTVPRLVDDGAGWTLNVPAFELEHPVALTTMMARALGHIFLVEALPSDVRPEAPANLTADYAAVALGLGPLLLEGSYVYSKGCGGPSVSELTRAPLPELAILCALYVEHGHHSVRLLLGELSTTQKALFSEAHTWAKSNAALVRLLETDPDRVSQGDYTLSDAKPWLLRLFAKKTTASEAPELGNATLARTGVARVPVAARPDPARDELRALVAEALVATRADAE